MAYAFTASSSQYLTIGTSSSLAYDKDDTFTVAGWFQIPTLTNGTAFQLVNKQRNTDGLGWSLAYFYQLNIGSLGVNNWIVMQKRNSANNQCWTNIPFTVTANKWHHMAASTTSAQTSGMTLYGDGTKGTNQDNANTLNLAITNSVVPQINGRNGANNLSTFNAAEVGIWNVALTDAEVASLANGIACRLIRPQSLVFYAPLIRDLIDVRGGLAITNNNTATVANHPRIYA